MPHQIICFNNAVVNVSAASAGKHIELALDALVPNPVWHSRVGRHCVIASDTCFAVVRNLYEDAIVPHPPTHAPHYTEFTNKRLMGFALIQQLMPANFMLRDELQQSIEEEANRIFAS